MKIGLIDVDGKNFPNLALMKISAYHKSMGDSVEWYEPLSHGAADPLDKVYMSKVFTFSADYLFPVYANEVERGGTGYKLYKKVLPEYVESVFPDYSIYPWCDYAIGFLTRGCIRRCPWCIVPEKEGAIRPASIWQKIKRPDSRNIVFMDNNVLASQHGINQIESLGHQNVWIDFNQGLDARLITPEIAKLLAACRWIRFIRLACDTSAMIPVIAEAVENMLQAGISKSRFWSYALVKDVDEAHRRILALKSIGVEPFAQPYRDFDGGEPTQEQKSLARWCNHKAIFKSCTWEEYKERSKL